MLGVARTGGWTVGRTDGRTGGRNDGSVEHWVDVNTWTMVDECVVAG